jgi:hypothetical protein
MNGLVSVAGHFLSLQPGFAQGSKVTLQYRGIFDGSPLLVNRQRELGIEPQDFGCLRPCS